MRVSSRWERGREREKEREREREGERERGPRRVGVFVREVDRERQFCVLLYELYSQFVTNIFVVISK